MKKASFLILCLLLFVSYLSFSIPLTRQEIIDTPTVWIKVYRIQAVDPIEGFLQGGADWYYYIYVWNGEEFINQTYKPEANHDDIVVDMTHSFKDVMTTSPTIYIALYEDDPFGYETADISGSSGTSYFGTYNLKDNSLSGDLTYVEEGYYKTSGDYDDSVDIDENDANLWFDIWDNYEAPKASAGSDQEVFPNDKVNFDASASTASDGSSIVKYEWDFENDGIIDAEGMKTSYTYTEKGQFTVKLKVMDNLGEIDTDTCTVNVMNLPPKASFTFSPNKPTIYDTVNFYDTSTDEDSVVSWYWEFGDGGTSSDKNPTHKYSDKGKFTVKLTVTDNDGATDVKMTELTIYNLPPIANFTYSPTAPKTNEDIQFNDVSIDPEGKTLTCSWNFGDGYESTEQNPIHKYTEEGDYDITLTVTDDEGETDVIKKTITVSKAGPLAGPNVPYIMWGGLILVILVAIVVAAVALKRRGIRTSSPEISEE